MAIAIALASSYVPRRRTRNILQAYIYFQFRDWTTRSTSSRGTRGIANILNCPCLSGSPHVRVSSRLPHSLSLPMCCYQVHISPIINQLRVYRTTPTTSLMTDHFSPLLFSLHPSLSTAFISFCVVALQHAYYRAYDLVYFSYSYRVARKFTL